MDTTQIRFRKFALPRISWKWIAVFVILATTAPFLGSRMIRVAGDDKLYVAQTVEMIQSGHWFQQTFNGEPNYYKGPLHYILVRVGFALFGYNMWATLYMNLILLMASALAIGSLAHRYLKTDEAGFFCAMLFALSSGVWGFTFASQMELEITAFYALTMYFTSSATRSQRSLYALWITIGIAGWLKSPVYSALLGVSCLLYWTWRGQLRQSLFTRHGVLAVIIGVAAGIAGYLPAWMIDRQNFLRTYWIRESVDKVARGNWYESIVAPLSSLSLPWSILIWAALFDGIARVLRRYRPERVSHSYRLCLSYILPTAVFFALHPYHSHVYGLPLLPPLALLTTSLLATTWEHPLYRRAMQFSSALFFLLAAVLVVVTVKLAPLPPWLPAWNLGLTASACIIASLVWLKNSKSELPANFAVPLSVAFVFIGLGCIGTSIGEREILPLKTRLHEALKAGQKPELVYNDSDRYLWSEWGYLGFMIHYPVSHAISPEQLTAAIRKKSWILVPNENNLQDLLLQLRKMRPIPETNIWPWKRWRARTDKVAWKALWKRRDYSGFEKDYFIVTFR